MSACAEAIQFEHLYELCNAFLAERGFPSYGFTPDTLASKVEELGLDVGK